jgi:hypothetical protein
MSLACDGDGQRRGRWEGRAVFETSVTRAETQADDLVQHM